MTSKRLSNNQLRHAFPRGYLRRARNASEAQGRRRHLGKCLLQALLEFGCLSDPPYGELLVPALPFQPSHCASQGLHVAFHIAPFPA